MTSGPGVRRSGFMPPWRESEGEGQVRRSCGVGAVRRQTPDDRNVDGDDHYRPDREMRDIGELEDHADTGHRYTDDPRPRQAPEGSVSSANGGDARYQLDPAPRCEVEREQVQGRAIVDLVVYEGGYPDEDLQDSIDHQHRARERDEAAG